LGRLSIAILTALLSSQFAFAQKVLSWQQVRDLFQNTNPTLRAAQIGIDESKAQEITAYLRPNPDFSSSLDQLQPFNGNPYRPLGFVLPLFSANYLHERQHKRELRLESAQKSTSMSVSQLADQQRNLVFNLRNAFVQALQAKAILAVAQENLAYYDRLLGVNRDRLQAGDISQVDLDRLELQRVQYETDIQTSTTNVRTAKILLLMLLNDRTPVEQFDITGTFDFTESITTLDELRNVAMATRPDLQLALDAVEKSKAEYKLAVANGSTDPTFGVDVGRNPPIPAYIGFSVNIPLRIFDRNQGEKARTQLDIRRNERLHEAAQAQVFSDVDSAWTSLNSNGALLRPYKAKYLQLAAKVRETVSFAYQHGGSSLLEFLNAQNDYRTVQLNYLNLVGSYLTAASQLNLAVGREVIQ
jgi:cobalt-zinc-cadmium efflux system outer membrane protein